MPKAARSTPEPTYVGNDAPPPPAFLPPLRPSRRMFLVGAALVAVWLGVLLTFYFTTVAPTRGAHGAAPAEPAPTPPTTLPAGTVAR